MRALLSEIYLVIREEEQATLNGNQCDDKFVFGNYGCLASFRITRYETINQYVSTDLACNLSQCNFFY